MSFLSLFRIPTPQDLGNLIIFHGMSNTRGIGFRKPVFYNSAKKTTSEFVRYIYSISFLRKE